MSAPQYSFTSPRRQLFAFPPDVIRSMLKNRSLPRASIKLIQTCKYFYSKIPILMADDMDLGIYRNEIPCVKIYKNAKRLNVSEINIPIWVIKNFHFCYYFNRPQLPRHYYYSVRKISLFLSTLMYEDFVLLTSDGNVNSFSIDLNNANIYHSDRLNATIYELLQCLPNIQHFNYFIDEKCSFEMLKKINKLKFNHKFKSFKLEIHFLHSKFDLNIFCEFIMKNSDFYTDIQIMCNEEAKVNLELAYQKLDPEWKKDVHRGLKQFFFKIESKWNPFL